jgi:hypothetical protein
MLLQKDAGGRSLTGKTVYVFCCREILQRATSNPRSSYSTCSPAAKAHGAPDDVLSRTLGLDGCKSLPHLAVEVHLQLLKRLMEEVALLPASSLIPLPASSIHTLDADTMREHFAVLDFRSPASTSTLGLLGPPVTNPLLPSHRILSYPMHRLFNDPDLPPDISEAFHRRARRLYEDFLRQLLPIEARQDEEHVFLLDGRPEAVGTAVALYRLKLFLSDLANRPLATFVLPTPIDRPE